jgi:hypothetical protein
MSLLSRSRVRALFWWPEGAEDVSTSHPWWWDNLKPNCCSECGNYRDLVGSTHQEIPCSIRCWKKNTGDCYKDPRKATVAQMKLRSILVRNSDPTKECSICLNPMKGRYVKKIFCGHTFHSECLNKWEETKRSCPMCRFDYTPPPSREDIMEDVEESIIDFKHSYNVWLSIIIPLVERVRADKLDIPNECDLEELEDALNEVVDDYDYYIEAHSIYCKYIRDISPSSRSTNKYRWACQLTSPILAAMNTIRTNTDGMCRDEIITHAFERVILRMGSRIT